LLCGIDEHLADYPGVTLFLEHARMIQGELPKAQGHYADALTTTQTGLAIFQPLGDSQGLSLAYNKPG
jgi:hypothetical protein